MTTNIWLIELEQIQTQEDLTAKIAAATFSASVWKKLAKEATGRTVRSSKDARATIHQLYSDRLLLDARVASITAHRNYDADDYAYLKSKGWTDAEITARWDTENGPCRWATAAAKGKLTATARATCYDRRGQLIEVTIPQD